MRYRLLLWALCLVLGLSLVSVAATNAQVSQAELVIINFVGAEMIFTLDGTPYTIPGTDTVPDGGKLTLTLTPGRHTYSGHVPGSGGANGEVESVAGESEVLGARLERSDAVVSSTDVVLEKPQDVLVFFEASLTPAAPQPEFQPAPLQPLPAGQGALVLVNYIGEELIIDIDGDLYTVPVDGRTQVDLAPGEVIYSASAGISGLNGTAQVTAGDYTGLGFTREIPPEEPDYEVGKPAPTPIPLQISVFPVPLDTEAVSPVATPTPAEEAPAGANVGGVPVSTPEGQGMLIVLNYIGETLTFTIDNQAYGVAGNGGQLGLDLLPGEYTFSASTPQAGTNGSLPITEGETTQVSVALDAGSGDMQVFVE